MKRLLAFLALLPAALFGAAYDVSVQQVNSSGTAWNTVGISPATNSLLGFDASKNAINVTASGNITVSSGALTLGPALTSINSVTSAALSTLTLGTGTFGTAVTFASATGIPTFAGNSIAFSGGSTLTDNSTGTITVTAAGSNQNVSLVPSGTGCVTVIRGSLGATPAATIDVQDTTDSSLRLWRSSGEFMQIAAARGGITGANNEYAIDLVGGTVASTRNLVFRYSSDGYTTKTTIFTITPPGSYGSWGAAGIDERWATGTYNDSSTAMGGTVALQTFHSFAAMTLTATNTTVTTSDAANVWIGGPIVASTNESITRSHSLAVVDSTSAVSSITGGVVIATTLGTSGTSIGLGGGNGNFGGTVTTGGAITSGTTLNTAAGATAAAGAWNLGALRTSTALTASTTNVLQVAVAGVLYSLMTCSSNP